MVRREGNALKCGFTPYADTTRIFQKDESWLFMRVSASGAVFGYMEIHVCAGAEVGDSYPRGFVPKCIFFESLQTH